MEQTKMDIRNFWRAVLSQDEKEIAGYFHPDASIRWHNTNEAFNVREFIKVNCEYPGKWDGDVERIERLGNLIITATHVYSADDPALSFHVVSFICLENDKIISVDEYWGDDGDAPQWRLDKHIGSLIKQVPCDGK